jgi:hypothetical protein
MIAPIVTLVNVQFALMYRFSVPAIAKLTLLAPTCDRTRLAALIVPAQNGPTGTAVVLFNVSVPPTLSVTDTVLVPIAVDDSVAFPETFRLIRIAVKPSGFAFPDGIVVRLATVGVVPVVLDDTKFRTTTSSLLVGSALAGVVYDEFVHQLPSVAQFELTALL